MHSGDNKEASPYTAIKSNDVMDFLGNPTVVYAKLGFFHHPSPTFSMRRDHLPSMFSKFWKKKKSIFSALFGFIPVIDVKTIVSHK